MTPQDFVQKWSPSELRERQGSQEHFLDLCRMLDEPTPAEVDPTGKVYCFDAGAENTIGADGFADVWKKGCFGWEYKGKHKNLLAAYAQLQQYSASLENPPLLIVSDMDTIVIHTNFTYEIHELHRLTLQDLLLTEKRRLLKWAFSDPERLRPGITRRQLTETAARKFAEIAQRLRDREYAPQRVAHFMNKMLFCMFAEAIGLLPSRLFTRLVELSSRKPQLFVELAQDLFAAMKAGGRLGLDEIEWFNGGLFNDDDTLILEKTEIDQIMKVSQLDWSSIEPSIFGTLFERGLDPDKRSQLGAHFTDPQSIMRIVEPVVLAPLRDEWETVREEITTILRTHRDLVSQKAEVRVGWNLSKEELAAIRAGNRKTTATGTAQLVLDRARETLRQFLQRLEDFRVLDPACGSGNFLYVALLGLKDLEHQILLEAEELGLGRKLLPSVGPQAVMGLEVNTYAAELARVTIWIGQIQWMLRHGWGLSKDPILKPLDQISCRDAILNPDGSEADWPAADCIVGNPPFLGDKKMITELGEQYVTTLRKTYKGRVPGGADLVTYWFDKSWQQIRSGKAERAGLVATNSIRNGLNRKILDTIVEQGRMYEVWSDEPWILEGAAVRVSIVCFARSSVGRQPRLDGKPVDAIYSDLTGTSGGKGINVTVAGKIPQNRSIAFQGTIKTGKFEITGELARRWLLAPLNPNGRPNSDVLRPWANGLDTTRRPFDRWIVDFDGLDEMQAALYQLPFEHLSATVRGSGLRKREERALNKWWLFQRPRPEMRRALTGLFRYIVTPRMATHRLFVWMDRSVLPDCQLFVFAREDDTSFGILHSRFHELWTLKQCSWEGVGNDPRYTGTTTFETFPFPFGLEPNLPATEYSKVVAAADISEAARRLDELRENWLNPQGLVTREPEVVPGFPDRKVPVSDSASLELKKRTLTKLYNERPSWLVQAHERLDVAVAAAYGWPADISEEEALRALLELNLSRSA
jgi:type II restriction/modification system DNA methylase subunit YeeA